ncbi:MAG: molybdate ABC transporter substrate-binding protein [Candidatus Dormibacteraeota bacterium]|nr:molybdate ABC transporter substrate-binding protein [Candidatus Dormibacteraeota bacterium]
MLRLFRVAHVDLVVAALTAAFLVACGSTPGPATAPTASPDTVTGAINVFAAASLTGAFKDEGAAFQTKHPKSNLTFNFAGSASLVTSINNGAPADVFASADQPNMDRVVNAGNATSSPANFATNKLQIVVPASNPKGIRGLADLANPGTVVILCAPAVPCGNYANQALSKAGVKVTPKSQEQDVNAVVSKVSLGEADAGIVYVTDVKAAGGKVQGVDIPDAQNVIASYPMATVRGGANPKGGAAFFDFVLSSPGQAILVNYGFSQV